MSIAPQKTNTPQSTLGTKNLNSLNSQYLKSMKTLVDGPNPNDDSLIDLQYEKALTTINYDRMRESVKQNHATKANGQYFTCGEACWSFNSGNHRCVGSSEKSDLTRFGVGVILYFKFVKHLIFFFFLFTLLSIPAYLFYISSYTEYNKGNKDSVSYIDLLMSTTVGSVGLGANSCVVKKYPTSTTVIDQKTMSFQCPTGVIASISNVVYGLVKTGTTCNFIDTTDLITSCNNLDTSGIQALKGALEDTTNPCVGKSSCENIQVPSGIFKSGDATCNEYYKTLNVYMKVTCDVNTINVFDKYTVYKSTVAYIVAGFDAGIIIIFLFMLYTLKFAQKNATNNVQKRAYSASSYTVELKNLPQTLPAEELAAKLWSFLDAKLGDKAVQSGHRVVDVQIVLPNKLIEYSKKVGTLIHTKNDLIRDFMEAFVPDYTKGQIDFNGLQAIMKNMIEKQHPKVREAEKMFKKIKDLSLKKLKTLGEIQRLKTINKVRIVSAFVTFSSIPARDRILDSFVSSPIDRIARVICNCYYDKDISFHGKILRAKTSADPGSILWENLGEPGPKIFARRTFSSLITLCLWVLSGAILIVSTYYKNNFKKSFPIIDCTDKHPNASTAATDYLLGEYQQGLLQCYCADDIINRLNEKFSTADNQTLCLTWFSSKVIETSITLGIVFVVLIINYFVQFVFQGLSHFEKHSTLNKQLATRVLKTFVAQFLNTGLMILLVNIKFDVWFWQGQFRDLTPLWYENVGSTLLSTMFINVVTVPSIKIIFVLFNRIARFCDRKCGSDPKITRKKTQTAYENLYSGPEFIIDFRYSQILTLTFVCFLYSSGMPLLYFSTLLQLVITYFFDKVFLLKISKLPKNYDQSLEYVVRPTMYMILIAHLIFAIFMFGQTDIFQQSVTQFATVTTSISSITDNISNDNANIVTKFFKRTVLDFNFVLTIALLAILAIFLVKGVLLGVLRRTIFALFMKDEEKTHKNGRKVIPDMLANFTFFHVIKAEDVAKLIRLTKVTLKTTQNPDLITHLKNKLSLLKHEYKVKQQGANQPLNFIGFFSYDVRLQPRYAAQFAIEEMLDDENLE